MAQKQLSQMDVLKEDYGIDLKTNSYPFNKESNPSSILNLNKFQYRVNWSVYDLNQYNAMLEWENLPQGMDSWVLNRMVYYRGSVAGFRYNGNVYVLPYVITGNLNVYGLPTSIRPITINGRSVDEQVNNFFSERFSLDIDTYGEKVTPDGIENFAFLLHDSVPLFPAMSAPSRWVQNRIWIDEIADTLSRVRVNIAVSTKKILLHIPDKKQAAVARRELSTLLDSDSPFEIISGDIPSTSIAQVSDFNADELFNAVQNWDNVRCFMSGIHAKKFGNEKKERVQSGEMAGEDEQVNLIADNRFKLAESWKDKMNKHFGTNIKVTLVTEKYRDEINSRVTGQGLEIFHHGKLDESDGIVR